MSGQAVAMREVRGTSFLKRSISGRRHHSLHTVKPNYVAQVDTALSGMAA